MAMAPHIFGSPRGQVEDSDLADWNLLLFRRDRVERSCGNGRRPV